MLARRPSLRRAGGRSSWSSRAFGVSMIVFGLSRSFPLSLAALAVSGFVDMISMNIRSTTVALATPNGLRGRVERGRDGLHQRLQPARRLRVGRGGRADRRGAGGRRRRRADDRAGRDLAAALPRARSHRPARASCAQKDEEEPRTGAGEPSRSGPPAETW